jgi:transglutaminase-like putative cysteine protease
MSKRPSPQGPRRGLGSALVSLLQLTLHAAWIALVVVVPLLAAWVASSLAAHAGGSARLAAASGLLVFPALPLLWELASHARRKPGGKRFLTLADRLVLRTLAVSLVFVGALLARDPRRAFVALNARGDWMLDGRHTHDAERARRGLFRLAATTEWLYRLTDDNPFSRGSRRRPTPQPLPTTDVADPHAPTSSATAHAAVPTAAPRGAHEWPWPEGLHPAVLALTPADETSPAAVGRFLAAREPDPWELARAVHDYVADRIAYDVAAWRSGVYPPQDAETTFRTRRSVCAGYAYLFEAVGRAAGLTVEVVGGRGRGSVLTGMGNPHAWNAVKLDGTWHLVDATWDAGGVGPDGFHKHYSTRYFLTPPEAFLAKHFPDEDRWQPLATPRTPGEYLRLPALDPEFFARGLRLVSPDRAELDARGSVEVIVDNPRGASLSASVFADGGAYGRCEVSGTTRVTARCPLAGSDLHEVVLYAAAEPGADHRYVGSLQVHNR